MKSTDETGTPIEHPTSRLPHWAQIAVIARCARRFCDAFSDDTAEPAPARAAVLSAVKLVEAVSQRGEAEDALEIDGQWFDNYDINAIQNALLGYAHAADNTHVDLVEDPVAKPVCMRTWAAIVIASLALGACFPEPGESSEQDVLGRVLSWATDVDPVLGDNMRSDIALAQDLAESKSWTDATAVAPDVLGPLWPVGRPATWPHARLTFRPRARIIRTIGDRLISGPEAAVIELVKNSYDADATQVRVTFFPPLQKGKGEIIVEDDGHGMSFTDIRDKWMEPATGDKQTRSQSPNGRRLLGSKGIGRFAAARLGSRLKLTSTAKIGAVDEGSKFEQTTISDLDWEVFERAQYLDTVSFAAETTEHPGPTRSELRISSLRDEWTAASISKMHDELRRLVSPISTESSGFEIYLDLSRCTQENSGFDGAALLEEQIDTPESADRKQWLVEPYPVLDACDYFVDGIFDEAGVFHGTMAVQRSGSETEEISISVPLRPDEDPCGIVLVRLSIFDREAESVRSTAQKAGFGHLGIREARKLLDKMAGVAIYRAGFRIRPYGDAENDWLTLDAKRVQNPTLKIGRNQVAGIVAVDEELSSQLVERSSREGLEENGSFRRLQSLLLALLGEVVEPKRRKFRLAAGIEKRKQATFKDVVTHAETSWADAIISRLPEEDRDEAKRVIARESGRLADFLKELDERQARLEAQVTLGLIVGEVMHQGNTPLAFIENEVSRLKRWWPRILDDTPESIEDRQDVPRILNGMGASASSLRTLFKALSPLAGARRGIPEPYAALEVVNSALFLFKARAEAMGLTFNVDQPALRVTVLGYAADLATAITNLTDNAMYWLSHHAVPSPEIRVTAAILDSGKLSIFVEDNGRGVPEDFEDQLFDVGFSLRPNGTGLGLSIAREAMFRSGGDLAFIRAARGARFALTLPMS